MRIRLAIVAIAALVAASAAAGSAGPYLRSAVARHGHVVVTVGLNDLAPGRILVAVGPRRALDGSFVRANVRIDEPLRITSTTGPETARTRHTLRAGSYWVEVSATPIEVDCMPKKPCRADWSNIRRVRVPRS